MRSELESAANELKLLASRQYISMAELERAKALMVELKVAGMSNREISELVDGRWSESTIKGHTRGVVAGDSPPWPGAVALFSELVSKGLTLKDVEQTIRLKEELRQQKTSITELASFIAELEAAGIDAAGFADLYWAWLGAGLKAPDVASALKLRGELEGMGLGLDSLAKVASLARNFGDVDGILDAVAKYGGLAELDRERAEIQAELEREKGAAQAELDRLGTEILGKQQTLQDLQAGIDEAKEALAAYKSFVDRGFDLQVLQQVAEAAERYASPSGLLEAINSFNHLADIETRCEEANRVLENKQAALESLEGKYSHLRSAIEMCERLMDDYGLGLEDISTILSAAERHGDPIEVLKATEAYGKLEALEEKVRRRELEAPKAEARIKALEKAEGEVKAKIDAALDLLEALNSKALEVGRVIGADEERMRRGRRFARILGLLEDPTKASYEESAPHVLALANVIHAFVRLHKDKFTRHFTISQALEELMEDLGKWRR